MAFFDVSRKGKRNPWKGAGKGADKGADKGRAARKTALRICNAFNA